MIKQGLSHSCLFHSLFSGSPEIVLHRWQIIFSSRVQRRTTNSSSAYAELLMRPQAPQVGFSADLSSLDRKEV